MRTPSYTRQFERDLRLMQRCGKESCRRSIFLEGVTDRFVWLMRLTPSRKIKNSASQVDLSIASCLVSATHPDS